MTGKVSTNLIDTPDWFSDLQKPFEKIGKSIKHAVKASKIYFEVKDDVFDEPISKSGKQWTAIKAFLPGINLLFDIPKFINHTHSALTEEDTVETVHHAAQSVLSGASIFQAGATIFSGMQAFGWVAKDTLPWMPVVSMILFPLNLLSIGDGCFHVYQGVKAKREFDREAPKSKPTDSLETRVANITKSCQYVAANKKKLTKMLTLSKDAAIGKRAEKLLEKLSSANEEEKRLAVEEGEAMMKTLRTRIHAKIGVGIASTVFKTAAFATSALLIFAVPTPVGPFILGGVAVVGVAFWLFERMVLNGDPFSAPKDVWYEKIPHNIRVGTNDALKGVRKMNKKVCQYAQNFQRNMTRELENVRKDMTKALENVTSNLKSAVAA